MRCSWRWIWIGFRAGLLATVGALLILAAVAYFQPPWLAEWDGTVFNPRYFWPATVGQRFPRVTGYQIVTAAEADELVDADELVLGVELQGQSRAYPINMLSGPDREIVNDRLAGHSIAATW